MESETIMKPWQIAVIVGMLLLIAILVCGIGGFVFYTTSIPLAQQPEEELPVATTVPPPIISPSDMPTEIPATIGRSSLSTSTPLPSRTPLPSLTPFNSRTPRVFSGVGNQRLNVPGKGILYITGDPAGKRFVVTGTETHYAETQVVTLVDTDRVYEGYHAYNLNPLREIRQLEVQAFGTWTITVLPLTKEYAREVQPPATLQGHSDTVLLKTGTQTGRAILNCSSSPAKLSVFSSHMVIFMSSPPMDFNRLNVPMMDDSTVLAVNCSDSWTLELTLK